MKINKFEEIDAWKRARELTKMIYYISKEGHFSNDWTLRDQIRKAAISVMSNITEGFDSGTKNEFVRFLTFSKRSTSEIQSQLYTALDQSYISQNEFTTIYQEAEEIRKMISGFIKYLKGIRN